MSPRHVSDRPSDDDHPMPIIGYVIVHEDPDDPEHGCFVIGPYREEGDAAARLQPCGHSLRVMPLAIDTESMVTDLRTAMRRARVRRDGLN